jgi:transcriptional regulator with XRE-family HTH domain
MPKEEVGDRIARIRESKGWSASDLARRMEVTPTAVWNWEKNGIQPRPAAFVRLARILGVTEEQLRNGSTAPAGLVQEAGTSTDMTPRRGVARSMRSVAEIIEDSRREIAQATGWPFERVRVSVELDK